MTKRLEAPGKRGRKNKYDTHVSPRLEEIAHWCRDGLTEEEICKRLGVSHSSFAEYKQKYPELLDTLKRNKEVADYKVEDSLYMNAVGYEYEEETWERVAIIPPIYSPEEDRFVDSKMVMVKSVKKKKHPDTTAQIFWLKNRKPHQWRDKQEIEHSGGLDNKLDLTGLSVEELRKLAQTDG
jgi:transcriptional regulator with XRE-family HTH domain